MENILSLLIWIPILGAIVVAFLPRDNENLVRYTSAAVTGLQFVVAIVLWRKFDPLNGSMQFMERYEWIPSLNISYILGVDGLSLPMVLLTAMLFFIGVFVSWNIKKAVKGYFALYLLLNAGVVGVFLSLDFFLFYIFWEVMLLPMYFLIGMWGGPQREYAAIKFFLYTLFGSVLMLIGILGLYFTCGKTFDILLIMERAPEALDGVLWWGMSAAKVIWVLVFIGFAIKVPVFPFHTWLPLAHVEAPTAISVLLAGILLKLGVYGIIRVNYGIMPDQVYWFAGGLAFLGLVNVLWGGLCALAQTDLKRLIAFSSVGHMGFVMLGISSLTSIGINAAMIGMVAHGIITGLLFFISGSMAHTYHTRDMGRLGGNMKLLPKTGALLGFTAMASLGLPGLAGFWGEFMALLGAYNPLSGLNITVFRTSMVAGAIGTVLTAGYLLWMLQRVNLGEPKEEWIGQDLHDADNYELAAWIPLVILTVLIGVFPKLIFGSTNDAVINLVTKAFGG